MSYDHGRFVWHELMTSDKKAASAYYGELFGWKTQTVPMPGADANGEYSMFQAGEHTVGGIVDLPKPDVPPHFAGYLSVPDVAKALEAVKGAGGKVLMDPMTVPGVGTFAPVADPQGGVLFAFRAENEDSPGATGPGTFHWDELWAQDAAAAADYYAKVFGFETETMQMQHGTYYILKNGDSMRAGILDKPDANIPTMWLPYVVVDDADAAVSRAKQNAGELLGELQSAPGVGRFGVLRDKQGAVIGAIKPDAG